MKNMDYGVIIHCVLAAMIVSFVTIFPSVFYAGVANMVLWYMYEYGQFHMSNRDKPTLWKLDVRNWTRGHIIEFVGPTLAGWLVVILIATYGA